MTKGDFSNRAPKLYCFLAENGLRIALVVTLLFSTAFCSTASFAQVDLVRVDKSKRVMALIDDGHVVTQFNISLGASPEGHKQEEGDERTPEGKYFLNYIKEDSAYYRAMHISYPNKNDQSRAGQLGEDPGGFIMVHGQKNGFGWLSWVTQNFDWTDGCIAITNSEMDDFIQKVQVGTPIEIHW